MSKMIVQDWIRHVDSLRETDELLARGHWHGYTHGQGGAAPMRGEYYLVRWEQPTVAVSHDDREKLVRLAQAIEVVIGG